MGKVAFMMAVAGGAIGALQHNAEAAISHQFELVADGSGNIPYGGESHNAGQIESIAGSFTPSTNRFEWTVTFGNQVTQGLTLAVNGGENPKNNPGQMALIYASINPDDSGSLDLAAYGYNGFNNASSYKDGDSTVAGNQTPDLIDTSRLDGGWVYDASVTDVGGKRIFSFSIDASTINGRDPLYPDPDNDPWTGVAFAEEIGIWMHSFKGTSDSKPGAVYTEGELTNWSFKQQGWFDSGAIPTQTVPTPGSLALVGLSGMLTARRRRRTS